jgi:AraC-like DNA-binding protein
LADFNGGKARPVPRLVFSTDQLPAGLDDRTRFRRWREIEAELFGSLDVAYATDHPFWARAECAQFGSVGIGGYAGSFISVKRAAQAAARDGRDEFQLGFNRSASTMLSSQRGRDLLLEPGAATLLTHADAGSAQFTPGTATFAVSLPRRQLLELVPDAEDLVSRPLGHSQPTLRYLAGYLDFVLGADGLEDDPLLPAHIETTLIDLIALALGAQRDAADLIATRGLRTARLASVLAEIKFGFTTADFSVRDVAARLGLSARYIQVLLQKTGSSFSERVLELRLQKARSMLANPRYARMRVSQIAYACGFNQAAHFNRCFRRRFGEAPTGYRGTRSV